MERAQVTAADRTVRRGAAAIALLLLAMAIAGLYSVCAMAQDYKAAMIAHDCAVAGALSATGVEKGQIAAAFVLEKTAADTEAGRALLAGAGYGSETQTALLPLVADLRKKYAFATLALSALFSFAVLAVIRRHLTLRDRQYQAAAAALSRFMGGDTAVRLPDCGEGSLSALFSAVNAMATSLTAHIEKEKRDRAFLKETISDISHQLKTPLSALSMYNEIIAEERADGAVVMSFAEKSRRELDRMEALIQNLMKLARLDAGTIELDKTLRPLRPFLEKCAAAFATRAGREGKRIRLTGDEAVTLSLDETWLGEAVDNLLKNALDHTKSGDTIEVSCGGTAVTAEIVISDDGEGIHPEDIHHIFKRFYRSRFSKDRQGVGIGLSIAKAIVEKHGGAVTVRSELGQGARFCLTFPKLTKL
ncbi:MAG TPA: HAMP domain-containing sensor histidine kinase [Terriglobales bacterium]|nr:HAMP domain-containing sensor histidine kinase [Terriglobales bacterium]